MSEQTLELQTLPLEEQVEQTFQLEIVKVIPNPDEAIASLKKYLALKVTDKASFRKADEARKDVKNVRVIGEKVCDAQRADLEEKKKGWIKKKTEWSATVGEVEDYLEAQTNEWKQAEQRRKDEEARQIEEQRQMLDKRLLQRQQELGKYSVLFADNTFMLGDVRYSYEQLREAPDDIYLNEILPAFKAIYDQHEQERAQAEKERQEAEDKQRQEAEQLRREQEAFRKEQAELKQQRYEIRRDRLIALGVRAEEDSFYYNKWAITSESISNMDNDAFSSLYKDLTLSIKEAQKAEEERKEQERIAEDRKRIFNERVFVIVGATVSSIGRTFNMVYAFDGSELFSESGLVDMPEDKFTSFVKENNERYYDSLAEAERKRQEEEEQKRERQRINELDTVRRAMLATLGDKGDDINYGEMDADVWGRHYNQKKQEHDQRKHEEWLEQERIKAAQLEEQEKERQAELTEGERWRQWKDKLQKFAADMPKFTNKRYSKMKAIAQEKFAEIQQLRADKISNN